VFYPGVELVADAFLSSDSDPYLDEHVYHGERLFPAVMGLEAMAQAAMALAATYDPGVLKQLGALGAKADVGTARDWYQQAADWGSPDAKRRLQELAQQ
jgi:hypothetical protein